MNLIKTINLKKTYITGKDITTDALKGITLEIDTKEFLAIAGPSGSGKTSLLNILSALDMPTSGKVLFENKDITEKDINQLADFRLNKIGFVFQSYNLINTLTAFENVEYIMLLQGRPTAERKDKAEAILKRVGLGNYLNRFPNEMSGGQQQRVAVARAIAAEPKVIIADEPTANLDSKTAGLLMDLMLELNEEKGITFIFSTHDPMIMKKAKRIIKLKDGLIEK